VGDHDDRGTQILPEPLHQIEDLGLDGHIEGRGGFIGDEQAGAARQSHGDHHPLTNTP